MVGNSFEHSGQEAILEEEDGNSQQMKMRNTPHRRFEGLVNIEVKNVR